MNKTKGLIVKIDGHPLLFTESTNFDMEELMLEKENIQACIQAYKKWLKNPLQDMPAHPDMSDFVKKSGVIGAPFNLHDPFLYAADKGIHIELEVDI